MSDFEAQRHLCEVTLGFTAECHFGRVDNFHRVNVTYLFKTIDFNVSTSPISDIVTLKHPNHYYVQKQNLL